MTDRNRSADRVGAVLPFMAAIAAMASFQVGAALAKGLYPAVGALGAAGLRLSLGAAMLMLLMRPWRRWPRGARVAPLIGLGICTGTAVMMFYMAIVRLPLGIAISLQFLGPLAVAITGSRKASDLLWAALGAIGVWSLVATHSTHQALDPIGIACALAAGAGWGGYIICGRLAGAAFGGATAPVATAIAGLIALPVGAMAAGPALFSPALLPLALLVALISTAIPFSLEVYALTRMPARTFAVLTSIEPAFGVLSGFFLLHENLAPLQVAGVAAVMIAAGGATWSSANEARQTETSALANAPPV